MVCTRCMAALTLVLAVQGTVVAVKLLLQDDEITMDRIMREVHVLSRCARPQLLPALPTGLALGMYDGLHHAQKGGCVGRGLMSGLLQPSHSLQKAMRLFERVQGGQCKPRVPPHQRVPDICPCAQAAAPEPDLVHRLLRGAQASHPVRVHAARVPVQGELCASRHAHGCAGMAAVVPPLVRAH